MEEVTPEAAAEVTKSPNGAGVKANILRKEQVVKGMLSYPKESEPLLF